MEVDQVEAETDASKAVTVENDAASETEGSKTGMCVFYFFVYTICIKLPEY